MNDYNCLFSMSFVCVAFETCEHCEYSSDTLSLLSLSSFFIIVLLCCCESNNMKGQNDKQYEFKKNDVFFAHVPFVN